MYRVLSVEYNYYEETLVKYFTPVTWDSTQLGLTVTPSILITTAEPLLCDPLGTVTIRSDNRKVRYKGKPK